MRAVAAAGAAALAVPMLAATAASAAPAHAQTHRVAHVATRTATQHRKLLRGTQPAHAVSGSAPVAASQAITFRVALKLHQSSAAEKAALAVATPGSATYRHYVTPQGFRAQYAPSAASTAKVTAYFRGLGMTVVGHDSHVVIVRGSAGAIAQGFKTSVRSYVARGQRLRTVGRQLSLPRSVGRHVLTVTGINQFPTSRRPLTQRASEPTAKAPAAATPADDYDTPPVCSDYWNQNHYTMPKAYGRTSFPTFICGYTPRQLRSAYGTQKLATAGQTGTGTKVAIIDAYGSPTIRSDANTYARNRGDAAFAPGQFTQKLFKPFVNQDLCGGEAGWNGEETLDVEAVHGMAPGAKVLYVGGSDCDTGIDNAQQWIVDNVANKHSRAFGTTIVSNSYGVPGEDPGTVIDPAELVLEHQIAVQAALEGVGFYFSTGDDGDNVIAGYITKPEPSYESSDPFVTGVGGTSLAVAKNGSYEFETGWGSSLTPVNFDADGNQDGYQVQFPGAFYFGGGGGVSTLFEQPYYQRGVVPDSLATSRGGLAARVAPDVSMVGDPYTGFLIGETVDGVYTESDIGGTSLATPLMAGLQAVVQGDGPAIGFANPVLYSMRSGAFHDVVPPAKTVATPSASGHNLVTFDHDSTLKTAPGYDDVTGRGSPYGTKFVDAERTFLN